MKKSLKVIASTAMVFSMFASVAMADTTTTPATTSTTSATTTAVKTTADFKDLASLDAATKAKIDAMLSKKVFEGVAADSFGIEQNMTRAQFAKVLVLIYNVALDSTVTTSSFNDVKADDKANSWAIPYIEAAKKAGLIDGMTNTTFAPGDNVTIGQFATALVKGLGKTVDQSGATWYADAVKQAIDLKILPEGTDGSKNATRADLVVGAFGGQKAYADSHAPAKVSVSEAKATGVYKVEVKLDKAVDTAVAKVALTKGTSTISTSTTAPVWSVDKKTVTLTTDTRITEGDYTVTLSGLDAATVDKTTATFKATDEQVSKIDFVSASDTIAYSASASVKLKASNQYGEAVSLGTSSFTALASGQSPTSFKKDVDGNFVMTFSTMGAGITQGNGIIPITVYFNNSNVTVSKNFKVGTVPILSKIETDTVTYSNTATNKLTATDDSASIPLKLYDQYGNTIVRGQFTIQGSSATTPEIAASNINPVITPYEENLVVDKAGTSITVSDLFDDNDNARVKVKLKNKVDKTADFTVNIYGGSSSATAKVSIGAGNLATKVEFDTSAVTIGASDKDVYVPLVVTDANGNKLSAQDIVDNATPTNRFTFSVSNGTASIQQTGADKGKLHLYFATGNSVGNKIYVSGQINQSQVNTFVQTSIPVGDARIPDRITVTTDPAAKAILGATDKVVYQLKDQYGKNLKDDIGTAITNQSGQTSDYRIKVEVTREGASTNATPISGHAASTLAADIADSNKSIYYFAHDELAQFNKGFTYTTNSTPTGTVKATVKAVVQKSLNSGTSWSDYSSAVSRSMESVKADTKLTYSLDTIGNLYSAQDKLTGTWFTPTDTLAAASSNSQFDKKIKVIAKDEAGNKVKLPLNYVTSVSSSDPSVVSANTTVTDPGDASAVQDGYVIGNKVGTATVSAVVYKNNGETVYLTQDVTVKADSIAVATITAGNTSADYDALKTNAWEYFNKDSDNTLKVTDNYGIEYKNAAIAVYNRVLGINYTVNTTGRSSGTDVVTIDPKTGAISGVTAAVTEFIITATAPNGKSVQVVVSRP